MVKKNVVVQINGLWGWCKASGRAVWHGGMLGWNAVGGGCKSHFEATCGAMEAMEVCRSSAVDVVVPFGDVTN